MFATPGGVIAYLRGQVIRTLDTQRDIATRIQYPNPEDAQAAFDLMTEAED